MICVEREVSDIPPEGAHTRVSKGVASVIMSDDFKGVDVFLNVNNGMREEVRNVVDILALDIQPTSRVRISLESDMADEETLQDLVGDVAFA